LLPDYISPFALNAEGLFFWIFLLFRCRKKTDKKM